MPKQTLFLVVVLFSILILLLSPQQAQADFQIPAPQQTKISTPTPTPDVLAYQSSGYGMSIIGIILFIILVGGFLFGYWRITH